MGITDAHSRRFKKVNADKILTKRSDYVCAVGGAGSVKNLEEMKKRLGKIIIFTVVCGLGSDLRG